MAIQRNQRALLDQLGDTAGPAPRPTGPVEAPPLQAPAPFAPGEVTPGAPTAPTGPAKTYAMEGFDAGKMADLEHKSPKYQIGRALQQFDPKAGLGQTGLMDALNALNIGQFSSDGGDGLRVANGDPRFEGMNAWDSIRGSKGDAPGWQFGVDNNLETKGGQARPQTRPPMAGGVDPMLGGDPLAGIQAQLAKLGGGSNIQALLAQLQGGQ